MDNMTVAQRSSAMSRVRGTGTKPEMLVRKALHRLGYRYKLHDRQLPGVPDLVFPSRKKIIFVHGCFWHQHGCKKAMPPASRIDFWLPKLAANRARDKAVARQLRRAGWTVRTVWECELQQNRDRAIAGLVDFLE
ncbi:MAG: very short patch repair endonuclease [Ramlibacter sp.]